MLAKEGRTKIQINCGRAPCVFLTKKHEEKKNKTACLQWLLPVSKQRRNSHHSPSPDWKNRFSQYPTVSRHTSQALLVSFFSLIYPQRFLEQKCDLCAHWPLPNPGWMTYYCLLTILSNFWTRGPPFHLHWAPRITSMKRCKNTQ